MSVIMCIKLDIVAAANQVVDGVKKCHKCPVLNNMLDRVSLENSFHTFKSKLLVLTILLDVSFSKEIPNIKFCFV